MRILSFLLLIFCSSPTIFAQKSTSTAEILAPSQVAKLFPTTVQQKIGSTYPIYRVYGFSDKSGQYFCLLTESRDGVKGGKDTVNYKLKAITVKMVNGTLMKLWEINDFVKKDGESSIWFWSKYIDFKDTDSDGLIEPMIVYGTEGANGYGDGRIKFIIYFKGQKIAIRHQNGVLDFERETQVDPSFYKLPAPLQEMVKQKMEGMTTNNQAIFPAGWQSAMKNRKTIFNERK